jgi:hypothetical protein
MLSRVFGSMPAGSVVPNPAMTSVRPATSTSSIAAGSRTGVGVTSATGAARTSAPMSISSYRGSPHGSPAGKSALMTSEVTAWKSLLGTSAASVAPAMTKMFLGDAGGPNSSPPVPSVSRQCAAVTTTSGTTSVPVQKGKPSLFTRATVAPTSSGLAGDP